MEEIHNKSPHSLKYENNRINVTGVINLDSFDDNTVVARLTDKSMIIKGDKLNVEDLNVKTGIMLMSGTINSLTYHQKLEKLTLIKRLFK